MPGPGPDIGADGVCVRHGIPDLGKGESSEWAEWAVGGPGGQKAPQSASGQAAERIGV